MIAGGLASGGEASVIRIRDQGVNSRGDVTVTPSLRTLNEAMLYKAM